MTDNQKLKLIKDALKSKIDTIQTFDGFKSWFAQVTREQIKSLIKGGLADMRDRVEFQFTENKDLSDDIDGWE